MDNLVNFMQKLDKIVNENVLITIEQKESDYYEVKVGKELKNKNIFIHGFYQNKYLDIEACIVNNKTGKHKIYSIDNDYNLIKDKGKSKVVSKDIVKNLVEILKAINPSEVGKLYDTSCYYNFPSQTFWINEEEITTYIKDKRDYLKIKRDKNL